MPRPFTHDVFLHTLLLQADLGGGVDPELGLHVPHPAFDPRNLLDLCLKGYLRVGLGCMGSWEPWAAGACVLVFGCCHWHAAAGCWHRPSASALWALRPSLTAPQHLDYVRSSTARQALAVNAARCLEALRARGAPPVSAPALAAVQAAAGEGERGRLAELVCMAAAAPVWSPATHRRWPEAFQAATRALLLALHAGSHARGSSAVPHLGPHEREEVLRRAAYPIADWMQLTVQQQAAARKQRLCVYRAAADDDELPTADYWRYGSDSLEDSMEGGSESYSSEAEEWPFDVNGHSDVSRDGRDSDVGGEWPSLDDRAGSDDGSEDA